MGCQNDMTEGYGEIGDLKIETLKLGRDKKRDVMNHVSTLVSLFLICSIRCIRLSYQLTGHFASFYGQYRMSFLSCLY